MLCRSDKSPITAKRITNIIDYLTFEVFKYAARGLYEKDKFMYTILLSLKIDLEKGTVKHEEFQSFIKGMKIIFSKRCLCHQYFIKIYLQYTIFYKNLLNKNVEAEVLSISNILRTCSA